ncbi:MAG TPA: rhomboid family intramembrane serine protease [Acidothermaceae bacterium]|nr:rhomboid family intramembrane serine protease [Acidothermaceae bacterium]
MKRRSAADSNDSVPRSNSDRLVSDARRALFVMAGVIALIWALQVVNWLDHYWLNRDFGLVARDPSRLPEIFTAPLLHISFTHIEDNSAPLFFLGFLAAYRGVRTFVAVTLLVIVTSGLGGWLFSPTHTVTVGASGVIFGYFSYVVVRGLVERHVLDVIVAVVVAVSYGSILRYVFPNDPKVSWQEHLFGLLGGIAAALIFRQRSSRRSLETPRKPPVSSGSAAQDRTALPPGRAGVPPERAALHKELDDLGLT